MNDAWILAVEEARTGYVVIAHLALSAPAGTVTLTGTVAGAVFSETAETTIPTVGAALLDVTVPVAVAPVGQK